jgi:hypothetical protein
LCVDCKKKGHASKESSYCQFSDSNDRGTPTHCPSAAGLLVQDAPVPKFDENVWAAPKALVLKRSREESIPMNLADNDLRNQINKQVEFAIDSGCTQSIVYNKALLSDYSNCHLTMSTANSGVMNCLLSGTVKIGNLKLKNCLYSPQLSTNLLSVSQLCAFNLDKKMP